MSEVKAVKIYLAGGIAEDLDGCMKKLRDVEEEIGQSRMCSVARKAAKNVEFVTHADYKALEGEHASLKARVAEFVQAEHVANTAECHPAFSGDEYHDALERRRLALEALK